MDADTVFETDRLLLRPNKEDDLDAVFERTSDPEVMRYHNCGTLTYEDTRTGLERTIRNAIEMWPFVLRAIVVKATNQNVGFCCLGPNTQLTGHPVEISYDVVRARWGNGYATEASAKLIQYGFESLNLAEIVAAIHPNNFASARIAEKLGLSVREKVEWPKQGLVNLYVITRRTYDIWQHGATQ